MSPTLRVLLFISTFFSSVLCYPGALCNVTYNIPLPCGQVFTALTAQMQQWGEDSECPGQCEQRHFLEDQRGPPLTPVTLEGTGEPCEKCPCGQKCLYRHTDTTDNLVKGSHITPVIRYVDDIIFEKLGETESECEIHGHSFSTGPAYFDYTTNYCNMRNLMSGSGMTELQGYSEASSTDLCMQYDKIEAFGNCNKF